MKQLRILLALFIATMATPGWATEERIGRFVLSIPPQFSESVSAALDANTKTVAYAVNANPGRPNAVLQITSQKGDGPPPQMSDQEMARTTSVYLLQMLGAIERARTNFTQTTPETVRLGGAVASRVRWTGDLQGFATNGTLYCVVSGSDLFWIHAFGPGQSPDAATAAAIAAVERIRAAPAGR